MQRNPFYFLRHGETDWNKNHIAMGQKDIPLNHRGVCQAKEATALLSGIAINTVVSSPLERAFETAEIIANKLNQPITVIDEFKEACWGIMEGTQRKGSTWIEAWRRGGAIEGAEMYSDFKERVYQGLQKALSLPGPVLIVSHGGVYWALCEMLRLPSMDLSNGVPMWVQPQEGEGERWSAYPLIFEESF